MGGDRSQPPPAGASVVDRWPRGARCLGRAQDIGSLEPGKLADIALWRIDDLDHTGIADPVAALVFGRPAVAEWLLVNGKLIVEHGAHSLIDEERVTADLGKAARKLMESSEAG